MFDKELKYFYPIELFDDVLSLQFFAAEDEGRVFDPTEEKKKKARENEGKVVKSADLISAVLLLVSAILIFLLSKFIISNMIEMSRYFFSNIMMFDNVNAMFPFGLSMMFFIKIILPIFVVLLIVSILMNFFQVGFYITFKPLAPKFDKVLPKLEKIRKAIFSMDSAWNLGKTFVKIFGLTLIGVINIWVNINSLADLMIIPLNESIGIIFKLSIMIIIESSILLLVLSIPDYMFNKHKFQEELKMSLQEVKDDIKEQEGDPLVKQKIKERHSQLKGNIEEIIKKADVVITNPTHFAVVLKYDTAVDTAPRVELKGEDSQAQNIKRIAREHSIPIVENKPLARSLYASVKEGDIVPETFFNALITVYTSLEKWSKKREVVNG